MLQKVYRIILKLLDIFKVSMIFKCVLKVCSGTLVGVLGRACIGMALCIGLLGSKIVYVCF